MVSFRPHVTPTKGAAMRTNRTIVLSTALALLCAVTLTVSVVRSEDKPTAMPTMSVEEKAMMDAMMKAAEVGPEHKKLTDMAGEWDAKSRAWKPDGSDCGSGIGTMKMEPILGGRYVRMSFTGEMDSPMGKMPFTGVGQIGYDNISKKYVSVWSDDMSTRPMWMEGTADGDVVTCTGQYPDPVTGKMMPVKDVATHIDSTHHKYELFMTAPDGKMYKCMEINYTKK
jgi:hypothetical protein